MASFTATTQYDNYTLRLDATEQNYSIANNTSDIAWTLYIVNNGRRFNIGGFKYTAIINGTTVAYGGDNGTSCNTTDVDIYGGVHTITSGVLYGVQHDSDGSKRVYCYADCNGRSSNGHGPGWGACDGYLDLTIIPRQANLTGAENFNDEGNPTITYNNSAGSAVTELVASIYNTSGNVSYAQYRAVNKTGNLSYQFNLTTAERTALRQACTGNSMQVKFYLRTLIGGSYYYSSLERTMTLVNYNPTFTEFEYEDTNSTTVALTGDNQKLVKGYSTVKGIVSVTNKAVANKEATMRDYTFACGNSNQKIESYSASSAVELLLPYAPASGSLTMTATDSRGNPKVVPKTATFINYSPLVKDTISIARSNGVSEETTLAFNGVINLINFGAVTNSIKEAKYRYKTTTSSSWSSYITITPTVDANGNFSFSNTINGDEGASGFSINNAYNIEVYVRDELSDITYTATLNSGKPNIALDKNGVGIMCKYDTTLGGALQVNGDLYVDGRKHNQRQISFAYNVDIKNYNIPTAWSAVKVPLNYNSIIGDYFTWDDINKRIVLNKDVSCLKFTACYNWYNSVLAGDRTISVRKNGAHLISLGYLNAGSNYYAEVSGEFISKTTYHAGDYFELYVSTGAAGTERLFDTGNYFSIEVME